MIGAEAEGVRAGRRTRQRLKTPDRLVLGMFQPGQPVVDFVALSTTYRDQMEATMRDGIRD